MHVIERARDADPQVPCLASYGSREQLLCDVAAAAEPGAPPRVLAMFALGGFHAVVASLGRPAGQELLETLAARLADETGATGRRYWPREDEFALLCDGAGEPLERLLVDAASALHERSGPVVVTAGVGIVRLPEEAADALSALCLADERLGAALPDREPRSRRRHLRPVPDGDTGEQAPVKRADSPPAAPRHWHVEQLLDLARTLTMLADAARIDDSASGGLQGQPRDPARIPLLAKEIGLKLTALRSLGGPEIPGAATIAAEAARRPASVGANVALVLDEIDAALARA